MTLEFDPQKFQEFFEKAAESNLKAWEAQTQYFEQLVKRNTAVFSDLANARVNSLQDISGADSFTKAFESNVAFEETLRGKLQDLYEENVQAWEGLQSQLKDLYGLDNELVAQIRKVSEEMTENAKKATGDLLAAMPAEVKASKPVSKPAPKKAAAKKPAAKKPAAKKAPAKKPAAKNPTPKTASAAAAPAPDESKPAESKPADSN